MSAMTDAVRVRPANLRTASLRGASLARLLATFEDLRLDEWAQVIRDHQATMQRITTEARADVVDLGAERARCVVEITAGTMTVAAAAEHLDSCARRELSAQMHTLGRDAIRQAEYHLVSLLHTRRTDLARALDELVTTAAAAARPFVAQVEGVMSDAEAMRSRQVAAAWSTIHDLEHRSSAAWFVSSSLRTAGIWPEIVNADEELYRFENPDRLLVRNRPTESSSTRRYIDSLAAGPRVFLADDLVRTDRSAEGGG